VKAGAREGIHGQRHLVLGADPASARASQLISGRSGSSSPESGQTRERRRLRSARMSSQHGLDEIAPIRTSRACINGASPTP